MLFRTSRAHRCNAFPESVHVQPASMGTHDKKSPCMLLLEASLGIS